MKQSKNAVWSVPELRLVVFTQKARCWVDIGKCGAKSERRPSHVAQIQELKSQASQSVVTCSVKEEG